MPVEDIPTTTSPPQISQQTVEQLKQLLNSISLEVSRLHSALTEANNRTNNRLNQLENERATTQKSTSVNDITSLEITASSNPELPTLSTLPPKSLKTKQTETKRIQEKHQTVKPRLTTYANVASAEATMVPQKNQESNRAQISSIKDLQNLIPLSENAIYPPSN